MTDFQNMVAMLERAGMQFTITNTRPRGSDALTNVINMEIIAGKHWVALEYHFNADGSFRILEPWTAG